MSSTKRQLLKAAWFTPRQNGRWGLPILIEDDPGTAKSSILADDSRRAGLNPIVLIASLRPPEDFLGFPMVGKDADYFSYKPPKWVADCMETPRSMVFFDEFTAGQSARVFAALLRIILEGVVGEVELPKETRFVAACNPPDQSPGGQDLPLPLANRFGHLRWDGVVTPDSWGEWMLTGSREKVEAEMSAEDEEKRVLASWDEAYSLSSGVWAGAVRKLPSLLRNLPDVNDPSASKAWPSPRSNEFACRAMASAKVHGLSEAARDEFISAFIGVPAAAELLTYMRHLDLPDPDDVLDGKVKFKHDGRRLDRTVAILNSCVARVAPKDAPKRQARAEKLWEICEAVVKQAEDLVVPLVEPMYKARLIQYGCGKAVLRQLAPALTEAGVMGNLGG